MDFGFVDGILVVFLFIMVGAVVLLDWISRESYKPRKKDWRDSGN